MSLAGQYDMPLFTSIFSSLFAPVPGLLLPDSPAFVGIAAPLCILSYDSISVLLCLVQHHAIWHTHLPAVYGCANVD